MSTDDLTGLLRHLYELQLAAFPDDSYLKEHLDPAFLNGTVQVFRFYEPYLPTTGRILDWGCHHAPDSCLIRLRLKHQVDLDGCDVISGDQYKLMHEFAGLQYELLADLIRLPYLGAC